jgi:hypothetical protein
MGAEIGEHPCNVMAPVIPAKAGIQFWFLHGTLGLFKSALGSRFRGNDGEDDFLVSVGAIKFKLQSDLRNPLSRLWGEVNA